MRRNFMMILWAALFVFAACSGQAAGPSDSRRADTPIDGRGETVPRQPDVVPLVDLVDDLPSDLELSGQENFSEAISLELMDDLVGDPFGQACLSNEDCSTGLCLETQAGNLCTETCIEECPEGFLCRGVNSAGPDLMFICVPEYWHICESCSDDADCDASTGICVNGGEGFYCGVQCLGDGGCPSGFECDLELQACVPLSGSCLCRARNEGDVRACFVANEAGKCPGEQHCLGESGWGLCLGEEPVAEVCDGVDNDCDGEVDEGMADFDGDGEPDCIDSDDDGDGVADGQDNCPWLQNQEQADLDKDGSGDSCDEDDDNDGTVDAEDTCPTLSNPDQSDLDDDGTGDACDPDDDGDGVPDGTDNCPLVGNAGQTDLDLDGVGDLCDQDDDNDGVADDSDNCSQLANAGQEDCNGDGQGDACDADDDGDGVVDEQDCAVCDASVYPGAIEACNGVDDDCDGDLDEGAAESCEPYICGGDEGCLSACGEAAECAPGYFCDLNDYNGNDESDECLPMVAAGEPCSSGFECLDEYCSGGYCCGQVGELCCAEDSGCSSLNTPAVCDAPAVCTGHRMSGYCNAGKVCKVSQVADPSGCAGSQCLAGNHCVGNAVHLNRFCDAQGGCSVEGALVQNCQGINPCCTFSCANGTCGAVFNNSVECIYLCWTNPIMCLCV